ncbi:MAG: hypothetical protein N3E51_03260 [Candidatus Micrarchaeota archaeon]|nr:hypothetical protein [Candidatus Micrarchaeota archaeon]
MDWRRAGLALAFALLMVCQPLFCDYIYSDLPYKTLLSANVRFNEFTVKLIYINVSYYQKPETQKVPRFPSVYGDNSQDDFSAAGFPVENGEIYFKFNGQRVSENGGEEGCYPAKTNSSGMARCKINFVWDSSEGKFVSIDKIKDCGNVEIEFKGGSIGELDLKPSSMSLIFCPKESEAISAFGSAIYSALTNRPAAAFFCFTAMLISGILVAAMYYSGRDPLSLFDLTTPRLPRTKQGRVSGGKASFAVRTAAARYAQMKKQVEKQYKKLLVKTAKKNKRDVGAAKKELKALLKELKSLRGKATDEDIRRFQEKLKALFVKYGLNPQNKYYRDALYYASSLVNIYLFADIASGAMSAARSAEAGGRLTRFIDAKLKNLSDRLAANDQKLQNIKGVKLLLHVPLIFAVPKISKKILDSVMLRRAGKKWIKSTAKLTIGQAIFIAGIKKEARKGKVAITENSFRWWFKGVRRLFDKAPFESEERKLTLLGKWFKWYYGWDFKKFVQKHDIWRKKLDEYRDEVKRARVLISEYQNSLKLLLVKELLDELVREERAERYLKEILKKLAKNKQLDEKEIRDLEKSLTGIFKQIRDSALAKADNPAEAASLMRSLADKYFHEHRAPEEIRREFEKIINRNIALLNAIGQHGGKDAAALLTELLKADERLRGMNVASQLQEIKKLQDELNRVYGISVLLHDAFLSDPKNYGKAKAIELSHIEAIVDFEARQMLQKMNEAGDKNVKKLMQGGFLTRELIERYLAEHREAYESLAKTVNQKLRSMGGILEDFVDKKMAEGDKTFFLRLGLGYAFDSQGKKYAVDSVREFESHFIKEVRNRVIREFSKHDTFDKSYNPNADLVSLLNQKIAELRLQINRQLGMDEPSILPGTDPGGSFQCRLINRIVGILNDPELKKFMKENGLDSIKDINELEMLFRAGVKAPDFIREITKALLKANKAQLEQIAELLATSEASRNMFLKSMETAISNRIAVLERLSSLDYEDIKAICKRLNIQFSRELYESNRAALHEQIVERLPLLRDEAFFGKRALGFISRKTGLEPETLCRSSLSEIVLVSILEKSFVQTTRWAAEVLKINSMINYRYEGPAYWKMSLEEIVGQLREKGKMQQQIEWAALRNQFLANQYEGSRGYHIETLLFTTRWMNRLAEQALVYSQGNAPWGGTILANFNSVMDHNRFSYLAKKAVFRNLIDHESTLFQDADYAMKLAALKGWTKEEIEAIQKKDAKALERLKSIEYDADAYDLLMKRGLQMRDVQQGLAYWISSDKMGTVPIIEFDKGELERQGKGIILLADKKGDHLKEDIRDYNPLLARFNMSDYASVVNGLVPVRIVSKEGEPLKIRRVDPLKFHEVERFYTIGESNINKRNEIANIIAATGSLKFMHVTDYQVNYAPRRQRIVTSVGSAIGGFVFAVFYDHIKRFNEWYVAANRYRDMLYDLERQMSGMRTAGIKRWDANEALRQYGAVLESEMEALDKKNPRSGASRAEILRDLIVNLQNTDKSNFLKRSYLAYTYSAHAMVENAVREAELEKKALKIMLDKGIISRDEYSQLLNSNAWKTRLDTVSSELRSYGLETRSLERALKSDSISASTAISALKDCNRDVSKETSTFTKALIEMGGSGQMTRSIFSTWNPSTTYRYTEGMLAKSHSAIEASCMRDTRTALGQKIGLEYAFYMGFDTGQGMYENPRTYASSLWEYELIPYLQFVGWAHKFFLPIASTFYRGQAGMSSYFFKTELEPGSAGKVTTDLSLLLRIKKGVSDFASSTWQNISNYAGVTNVVGALQTGGRIKFDELGRSYIDKAWYSNLVKHYAVPSEWYSTYAAIQRQASLQDKIAASDIFKKNEIIVDGEGKNVYMGEDGKIYYGKKEKEEAERAGVSFANEGQPLRTHDLAEAWVKTFNEYMFSYGSKKDELREQLREYENLMKPYMYSLVDFRAEGARRGTSGKYFMEDGSRYRFMNLYLPNYMNAWMETISVPGAFELNPLAGGKELGPRIAADISRAEKDSRLGRMQDEFVLRWNEALQDFIVINNSTIHQDAVRDHYYYRTPALLHTIKYQSYLVRYEWLDPWLSQLPGYKFLHHKFFEARRRPELTDEENRRMRTAMATYLPTWRDEEISQNIALREANYNPVFRSYESRATFALQRFFYKRIDSYIHRCRLIQRSYGLPDELRARSSMAMLNMEEMFRLTLLLDSSIY